MRASIRSSIRSSLRESRRSILGSERSGYQPLPMTERTEEEAGRQTVGGAELERQLRAATGSPQAAQALSYLQDLAAARTDAYTFRNRVDDVLHSTPFQVTMVCLITANAAIIGFETDYPDISWWAPIEHFFLLFFFLEMIMRFTVQGLLYFDVHHQDFLWNILDVLVVGSGLVDLLASATLPSGSSESAGSNSAMGVLRLMRLIRILRIFRLVRFLRELYMLAFSMMLAAVAIFWVTILMTFILYVCSILVVRTAALIPEDAPYYHFAMHKFGNIPTSMLTLFEFMLIPEVASFHDIMNGEGVCMVLAVFLMAFAIFGSFGLIALLSGVIHESMFEKNLLRIEENEHTQDCLRLKVMKLCNQLFDDVACKETHEAPMQSIIDLLPEICDLCHKLGVQFARKDDLHRVVYAMDLDASGTVSKQEFHQLIAHMIEGVRPLMLLELNCDLIHYIKERFDKVLDEQRKSQSGHRVFGEVVSDLRDSLADAREEVKRSARMLSADFESKDASNRERLEKLPEAMQSATSNAIAGVSSALETRLASALQQTLSESLTKASRELELALSAAQRTLEAGLAETVRELVSVSVVHTSQQVSVMHTSQPSGPATDANGAQGNSNNYAVGAEMMERARRLAARPS